MNNNKFLDLTGLAKYDGLIKAYIASGDGALRAELDAAIAALNAKIGELDGSDDKTLAENIEDIYASLAGIIETQNSLVAKDAEIEGKIAEEIGKIVGALAEGETAMTLAEVAASLKSLGDRVTTNEGEIAGVKERVTAVEEAIKNLGEIEGGESLGEIVSEVKANTAALATLKGDAETVTAAVNKIAKDAADAAQAAAEATAAADATSKAAAALAAAKEYADGLAGNYDAAGTAAGLNAAMDERVKVLEAIDHEKLTADAVAAVVAGAEPDFDTLKEVADWIASDKEGSAALQTTVSNHTESITILTGDLTELEEKVDEDIANLTTHMSEAATALAEVDGRLDALEAFEESHASIEISEIEGLFA